MKTNTFYGQHITNPGSEVLYRHSILYSILYTVVVQGEHRSDFRHLNKNSKEISLDTLDRYWGYFAFAKMKSATSTCSRIPIRVIKYLLKIVSKSFFTLK